MTKSAHPKPTRIKDVAEALELSMCTVSRILNDRMGTARYRPETIALVRRTAAEMGCRPDLLARSLASGKTHTIGLCLADIANPLFSEFAAHFERNAAELGYSTFISNTSEDPAIESHYVDVLLDRRVEALVISPVSENLSAIQQKAAAQECQLVLFDRPANVSGTWSVQIDNRQAMKKLTSRALEMGHRKIGVLLGSDNDASLQLRLQGVKDAIETAGLKPTECLQLSTGGNTTVQTGIQAGHAGLLELMNSPSPPSLILSLANVLSQGALQAARELGLTFGQEISLAGFDDFPGSQCVNPPVTVVAVPIEQLAKLCAEIACGKITTGRRQHNVTTSILWRESLRPPRNP